jgi:hypothetical protein
VFAEVDDGAARIAIEPRDAKLPRTTGQRACSLGDDQAPPL